MRKMLCLLMIILILFSSVSLAQNKFAPDAPDRLRHIRYLRLAATFEAYLSISSPLRKYLSDLFKTDFDNIANAPDVIKRLLPTFIGYVENTLRTKYGVDISDLFMMVKRPPRKGIPGLPVKPTLPPELEPIAGALGWGLVIIGWYIIIDEAGERMIVTDLQDHSNFTHDQAIAAAEHITREGSIEAGQMIDQVNNLMGLPGVAEGLFTLANYIEEIYDAKDYDPADYDPNEGYIPDRMLPGPGHRRPIRSVGDGGGVPGGGFFTGRPGPGQGVATGNGNNGNGGVTIGPCSVFGPIDFDALGNPIWGWYTVPC
jgi:hypothetical protein